MPKEERAENSKAIVLNLLNNSLDVGLIENDISICHRFGKPSTDKNKSRNIIAKFCRRDIIDDIFKKCSTMKPNFFVNHSQTPNRAKISYLLRQLKRKDPSKIVAVVATNGDPVALVPASNRPIRSTQRQPFSSQSDASGSRSRIHTKRVIITTKLELEQFVRDYFHTTLQELNLCFEPSNVPAVEGSVA